LAGGKTILYVFLCVADLTMGLPKCVYAQTHMKNTALKAEAIALAPNQKPSRAPGRKTAQNPVWVCVTDGIWQNTRAKKPWLYERPIINGRGTFQTLGTTNLKQAKLELARRLVQRFDIVVDPTPKEV